MILINFSPARVPAEHISRTKDGINSFIYRASPAFTGTLPHFTATPVWPPVYENDCQPWHPKSTLAEPWSMRQYFSVFRGQNLKPVFSFVYSMHITVLSSNNHLKCLSRTTTKFDVNKELMIYEYANKPIQGFAVAMITYPRGVNQIKSLKKKMSASSVI